MERRKYLARAYKDYYKSFTAKIVKLDDAGLKGYAARVDIHEVNRPLIVGEKGAEMCLANDGYSEIQFQPEGENWGVIGIYDDKNKIIEYYIDITRKNGADESGAPYCDDLYLDIVLMPDGKSFLCDEDELREALESGDITKDDYDLAYRVKDELYDKKIIDAGYMDNLFEKLKNYFDDDSINTS